jgi:glutamate-1-semialdehyde 2,1-aminomutase
MYDRLDTTARRLAEGIRAIFAELSLPYAVLQLGSIVDFKFRPGPPVRDYDQAREADKSLFAAYYHEMRRRGILLAPSQNEVMFLSTAHGEAEVERTLEAIRASLRSL